MMILYLTEIYLIKSTYLNYKLAYFVDMLST